MKKIFTYLWEFKVSPGCQTEFEHQYGPKGAWACFFRQSQDYLGTSLLQDDAVLGRYITVDRWRSKESYLSFRTVFAEQYAHLDDEFEHLTDSECLVGEFNDYVS